VEVRDAWKAYKKLPCLKGEEVLNGLNMTVSNGVIYGLLGPSGCGKTTLLRCILGRLKLDKGEIVAVGGTPGALGHTVPGKDVGYMPQEMALVPDFTIRETLYYFGILHGVRLKEIKKQIEFLQHLLELPAKSKLIKRLSGGQQRRVSFAVALLHKPPLLILDEPTVGVDPVLRAKIWKHLLDLSSSQGTSVLLTTHYIEEAKHAHVVGLMREGVLLAEAPPRHLLQECGVETLEDVFLSLCMEEGGRQRNLQSVTMDGKTDESNEGLYLSSNSVSPQSLSEVTPLLRPQAFRLNSEARNLIPTTLLLMLFSTLALIWKNAIRTIRNPGLLLFQFILPALEVVVFCLAIGRNLEGIGLVLINQDNNTLGTWFMESLKSESVNTFNFIETAELEQAISTVKSGDAWGLVYVGPNYTASLQTRIVDTCSAVVINPGVINESTVFVRLDNTNAQITATISHHITTAFEKYLQRIFMELNWNASESAPPVQFAEPIYGSPDLSFTDYIGPGLIIAIEFGIAIGLTAFSFIIERNEGLLERTLAAGINVMQMVVAQVAVQIVVLVGQTILMAVVLIYGFKVANEGSIVLVGLLTLIQGLTGVSYGLLISAVCSTEVAAIELSLASFYPILLLSGIIWPLEGMPVWLRYIAYAMPSTFGAQALRSIMSRGWDLSYLIVWRGFAVSSTWMVVFLASACLALQIRK
jgi:ABC-type multidrug transport system ATPase subunit/ABC-type multidrug transport system permease subunit